MLLRPWRTRCRRRASGILRMHKPLDLSRLRPYLKYLNFSQAPLRRPWEDPLPEAGERHLAQELRGVGLTGYEQPEWKTAALGKVRCCCDLATERCKRLPNSVLLCTFDLSTQAPHA